MDKRMQKFTLAWLLLCVSTIFAAALILSINGEEGGVYKAIGCVASMFVAWRCILFMGKTIKAEDIVYSKEEIIASRAEAPLEKLWNASQEEYLADNLDITNEILKTKNTIPDFAFEVTRPKDRYSLENLTARARQNDAWNVNVSCIQEIIKLNKLDTKELRRRNKEDNYPAYTGKELTRYQLIYQLVFKRDAPEK